MNVQYSAAVQLESLNDPLTPTLYDGTPIIFIKQPRSNSPLVKAAEFRKQSASRKDTCLQKGSFYLRSVLTADLVLIIQA
jgi:hypothetical protein